MRRRASGQREMLSAHGQVSLEVGFALAAAFLLLIGALVIFGWLNSRLVYRQERYEGSATEGRVAAGLSKSVVLPDEEALPAMDIFNSF